MASSQMPDWVAEGVRRDLINEFSERKIQKEMGMASAAKLRKAEEKGKAAALKKRPRSTNPFEDSDPQHDMFDQGWRQQSQSGKATAV